MFNKVCKGLFKKNVLNFETPCTKVLSVYRESPCVNFAKKIRIAIARIIASGGHCPTS